jgi:hypothetical protein
MTYRPGPETVIAEVATPAINGVFDGCPRPDVDAGYAPAFTQDVLVHR